MPHTRPNTRRAYKSDLEHFRAWAVPVPCNAIHRSAISRGSRRQHCELRHSPDVSRRLQPNIDSKAFRPVQPEIVRLTFRGIRRTFGHRQRRVSALTMEKMKRVLKVMDRSARDTRDKALLLIGFAGAFRRSELCAIRSDWIAPTGTGIRITLPQSKTDQERIGRSVTIAASRCAMCPVAALDYWFEVVKVNKGPVFRVIDRAGRILSSQLSPEAVAQIVKGRTAAG